MSETKHERLLRKVDELDADYGQGPDGMLLPYVTHCYRLLWLLHAGLRCLEYGVSAFHLDKLDVAAERLSAAAAAWPGGFARDQGLCLARLAVVEVARGNIDVACAVGRDALAVARIAESARTRAVLVSLNQRLAPYDRDAFVSEFRRELVKRA